MNNTQQIIQDAIEGGYLSSDEKMIDGLTNYFSEKELMSDWLLDPLFWQAVGKTRGWVGKPLEAENGDFEGKSHWKDKWHQFIDYLAEGDDIETALSKIV